MGRSAIPLRCRGRRHRLHRATAVKIPGRELEASAAMEFLPDATRRASSTASKQSATLTAEGKRVARSSVAATPDPTLHGRPSAKARQGRHGNTTTRDHAAEPANARPTGFAGRPLARLYQKTSSMEEGFEEPSAPSTCTLQHGFS
ncbi:MAG: hypothetical protein ACLT3W_02925 [Bifidobacterium pseudocatenulatum]